MKNASLTLEDKITVFKTLAISKIVYLSMMIKVPTEIIVEWEKIQKRFIWPTKPKIKTEKISSDFKDGVLKNVDINQKIPRLQWSRIRRLHDGSFHEKKWIHLKLIKKSFGDELKSITQIYHLTIPMSDIFHSFTKIFCWTGNSIYQKIMKPFQAFFYKMCGSTIM